MKPIWNREVDRYAAFGAGLVVFGSGFGAVSFLILQSAPLTALGVACVILGASIILVPSSPVPEGLVKKMVESATVNVEALLEEYDARGRAVYVRGRGGAIYAFVPLSADIGDDVLSAAADAPVRVLTNVRGEPGILVFPPGAELANESTITAETGVEDALSHILVDTLEAAEAVRAEVGDASVSVTMKRIRMNVKYPRFRECLGSLPAAVSGSILSTVLDSPVLYVDESSRNGVTTISYRVLKADG